MGTTGKKSVFSSGRAIKKSSIAPGQVSGEQDQDSNERDSYDERESQGSHHASSDSRQHEESKADGLVSSHSRTQTTSMKLATRKQSKNLTNSYSTTTARGRETMSTPTRSNTSWAFTRARPV